MGTTLLCEVPPTVTTLSVVSLREVSPGLTDYEVTVSLRNNAPYVLPGAVGYARSTGASNQITEAEILIGDLAPGETRGTPDTFIVRAPTNAADAYAIDWAASAPVPKPWQPASGHFAVATVGLTGGTVASGSAGATFEGGFAAPALARVYVTDQP